MRAILPLVIVIVNIILCSVGSAQNITYSVDEGRTPPVFLGNVADDSNISARADQGALENMKYSFLSIGNSYSSKFLVDEDTGALYTNEVLDRENLCSIELSCILSLRIGASSGVFFQSINVNVSVNDVNDNAPLFIPNITSISASEGSAVNSTYPIPSAVDRDVNPNFVIQSYQLQPDTSPFSLVIDNSSGGSRDLKLVLRQKLDREKTDRYELHVVAQDGGSPKRSGVLVVNVTVEDVNDNKPIFSYPQYNITVLENVSVGNVLIQVSARDDDEGLNGAVFYEFSPLFTGESRNFFSINGSSGEITLQKQLTFTSGQPHRLVVKASDRGSPPQSSQAYVNIHVTDTNNHSPEIKINLISDGKVKENSNNGTVIAYVAVIDRDTGRNALVVCQIRNSKFQLHTLADNEYKVVVYAKLDRESEIEHVVTIVCEDDGTPKRNSSESFIVQVLDVNDHSPTFEKDMYTVSVSENKSPGEMITKVSASDKDQDQNAKLIYSVQEDFKDKFRVDGESGIITTRVEFDREVLDHMEFKVYAADQGSPIAYTASTMINLTIEDENDNMPTFDSQTLNFSVSENHADIAVGTVVATDKDSGANGDIIYNFPLPFQNSIPFTIHPVSGEIRTNRKLNREDKSKYSFVVMATDKGVSPRNSSVLVNVDVLDENDEYPQIVYPLQSNGSIKVGHDTYPNSVVTKVEAFDLDDGENGTLKYSIRQRNDDNLFYIDGKTGTIYLARKIENYDIKDYSITIEVSDRGTDPKSVTVEVKLTITYTPTPAAQEQAIGQNVLIAITIACVTIVLSLAIIVTIFLIRRVDYNKKGQPLPPNSDYQIAESMQYSAKKSCLTKSDPQRTHLCENNNFSTNDNRKEVSFSLDDGQRDSGVFMIGHEHPSPLTVSTNQNPVGHHHNGPFHSPPNSHSSPVTGRRSHSPLSDGLHEELHRMASIRLHEKYLHSFNKPLVYHPEENKHFLSLKRHGDDNHSNGSDDLTVSDSGRGGSMEDVHKSSIMI
ncbi:hypothetical protein FSP39_000709 [Pinctada imbricata]|uniref:Cadherin domain-containing protein n=1 Tax=Pinctada imbricata TaxID=66713 RepID=A0AA89C4M2_PINIB|nr:hypothetical protein FSP39_000709 [Pinctada imbricata]